MSKQRILGQSPAGNRSLDVEREIVVSMPPKSRRRVRLMPLLGESEESPDRDPECAGCASLQVEVNALRIEVETLTGTLLNHQAMLADLHARVVAQEWSELRGTQQRLNRRRLTDAALRQVNDGAITTEAQ